MSTWILVFLIYFLNGQVTEVESKKGFGRGEQEWGYVTVRENAHMFWWLYYVNPLDQSKDFNVFSKPLIIWLQGGPGASSTGYGNFEELGPLDIDLNQRNNTWVNDYNVLFIDNPVGSGFSYVEDDSAYVKNNLQIAQDLVVCIKQFLEVIPEFKNVSTYITSESYGGKMAAEFALLWYQAQNKGEIVSQLKGVALGDSWISPVDSVLSWAPYLLHTGMIDTAGFKTIHKSAEATQQAILSGNWTLATELWGMTEVVIFTVTDNIDFYNILKKVNPTSKLEKCFSIPQSLEPLIDDDVKLADLMNGEVKKTLGLNVTWGDQQSNVFYELMEDFMRPVTNIVERLLNETSLQVFVFSGQLDLIVATPGTLAWVEKLQWKGAAKWRDSPRYSVNVNHTIEGYVKEYENLKMYWINRAGHMVPRDNPDATKAMLQDLTSQKICNVTDTDNNHVENTDDNIENSLSEKPIPRNLKKSFRKSKIIHP
ncbi:retinoid-inducible serine carboxypeptidase-like [Chelonus insularis]|uniref:retinoid-inducible serine carboxypeptidase-like n=1 Tax=Chelonus insularis TaxID=460826 RepID=UPI00158C82C3|nr:retinoid-inducible serine carboxypeptidase-like [Chelonus insularis]